MFRRGLLFFAKPENSPNHRLYWQRKRTVTFYQNYRSFVAKVLTIDKMHRSKQIVKTCTAFAHP